MGPQDKVMVLSGGELMEFDTPANLLRNPDSYFTSMVQEYGETVAAALTKQAMDKEANPSPAPRPPPSVEEAPAEVSDAGEARP